MGNCVGKQARRPQAGAESAVYEPISNMRSARDGSDKCDRNKPCDKQDNGEGSKDSKELYDSKPDDSKKLHDSKPDDSKKLHDSKPDDSKKLHDSKPDDSTHAEVDNAKLKDKCDDASTNGVSKKPGESRKSNVIIATSEPAEASKHDSMHHDSSDNMPLVMPAGGSNVSLYNLSSDESVEHDESMPLTDPANNVPSKEDSTLALQVNNTQSNKVLLMPGPKESVQSRKDLALTIPTSSPRSIKDFVMIESDNPKDAGTMKKSGGKRQSIDSHSKREPGGSVQHKEDQSVITPKISADFFVNDSLEVYSSSHGNDLDTHKQKKDIQPVAHGEPKAERRSYEPKEETSGAKPVLEHTALVSNEQIKAVASTIPANAVTHLARAYLCLSDTDIENFSGRLPVTISDIAYKGWKMWTSKDEGGRTVQHARQILNAALGKGVDVEDVIKVLDDYDSTDLLDNNIISKMSCLFTKESTKIFLKYFLNLHLSFAGIENQLHIQDNSLQDTTVGILIKWRNNNGTTATVQNLIDVLTAAVNDGWITDEVIQALYKPRGTTPFVPESNVIESRLRILYQTDQYSMMSPLSWDENAPAYQIQDMYVTMNCQQQIHHPSANKRAGKTPVLSMSKILVQTYSGSSAVHHRILLEGQPGSGKTTLCKKLAYDWSRCVEKVKGLLAYHCVFVIRLSSLRADQSIADYIATELLNESKCKDMVKIVLTSNKCLIILDGYDELNVNNEELNQLVNGTLYTNNLLLLTSRPGATNNLKNSFNLQFSINSLTDMQIVQFSESHNEDQIPMFTLENVSRHPLRIFVTTPLYLSWVCMLHDALSGAHIKNVSDFYRIIINAIYDTAVQRLTSTQSHSPQDIEAAFVDLSEMAYKAMCEDNMDLDGSTCKLTRIQQCLGFTNTYYKQQGLQFVQYHNFNHKTLLEYLTAKHIVHTTTRNSEDLNEGFTDSFTNSVVSMLLKVVEVKDTIRCVSSSIVQFVLGQLAAENRCIDTQAVLQYIVLPAVQLDKKGDHTAQGHFGLMCMAQCSNCTDLYLDDNRLVGKNVLLSEKCSSSDCTKGLAVYIRNGGVGVKDLHIYSTYITKLDIHPFTTVKNLMPIIDDDSEAVRMLGNDGLLLGVRNVSVLQIERGVGSHEIMTAAIPHLPRMALAVMDPRFSHRTPNMDQLLQSVYVNVILHQWQCFLVQLEKQPLSTLLTAWRKCSDADRIRVKWSYLKLHDCHGSDEEKTELKNLLPKVKEIVWIDDLQGPVQQVQKNIDVAVDELVIVLRRLMEAQKEDNTDMFSHDNPHMLSTLQQAFVSLPSNK